MSGSRLVVTISADTRRFEREMSRAELRLRPRWSRRGLALRYRIWRLRDA